MRSIQQISLGGCSGLTGDVTEWSHMYDARYIDLYGCGGLTGDVSHWLAMSSASYIDLAGCGGLTGDVSNWNKLRPNTETHLEIRTAGSRVCVGLGHIVALYYRPSSVCHIY